MLYLFNVVDGFLTTLNNFIEGFTINQPIINKINKINITKPDHLLDSINNHINNIQFDFMCYVTSNKIFEGLLEMLINKSNYSKPKNSSTIRFEKWNCLNFPKMCVVHIVYDGVKIGQYNLFE